MKQKLLKVMTMLLLLITGATMSNVSAQTTVNIVNGTNGEATYGSWSGLTWTSNASSGAAGLTMTFSDGAHDKFSNFNTRYNLAYHPATANTNATLTLTAPMGYVITGYSVETGVYQAQTYTLTTADATPITPANLGSEYTPLTVSNLLTSSTAITITTTDASKWLALANFSVTLRAVPFCSAYGEKWVHILGAKNNSIAMGVTSGASGEEVKQKNRDNSDDGQLWCLVGDANSFKVYNKKAGENIQMASANTTIDYGIKAVLAAADAAGTDWKLNDWFSASDGPGWGIFYAGSDGSKSLNAWSGYGNGNGIAYWDNTTSDGGSHWLFEEVVFAINDVYTINNTNPSRGALIYNPDASTKYVWSSGKSGTFNASDANSQWVIYPTGSADRYYLYNVGAGKFAIPSDIANGADSPWIFSNNAVPLTFTKQADGTYKIKMASNPVNGANAAIVSVSNGQANPIINYDDAGSYFTITKVSGDESTAASAAVAKLVRNQTALATYPQTTGWYAIQINSKDGDASYAGRYLFTSGSLHNGLYPLAFTGAVDVQPSITDATYFTYINHTDWNVNNWQLPDGRYLVDNGSSKFPTPSSTSGNVICGYDSGNYFKSDNNWYADPYNSGSTYFIGETTSKRTSYNVYPIDLSAAGLQPWQVTIIGGDGTQTATCSRTDVSGLTSVYNNGYFFLPTGVTPTESDFSLTAATYYATIVDSEAKTVTFDLGYSGYALVVQDAEGTPKNDVAITYSNPDDADMTRTPQQNGGSFAIKDGVTPSTEMFSSATSVWKITDFDLTGTTITITVEPNYVDGIYTISNIYNGRGTIVYQETADPNSPVLADVTLSGYENNDVDLSSVVGDGKYWYVRTTNDGTYFYNLEKKMFLASRTESYYCRFSATPVALTLTPAANPEYWNIMSGSYFLNTSPAYPPGEDDVCWNSSADASADHLTLNAADVNRPTEVALVDIMIDGTSVTTISEGRYVIKNRGRGKYLTQSADVLGASDYLSGTNDIWDVVELPTTNEYLIHNVADGRYIKWTEGFSENMSLVTNTSEATRFTFSTAAADVNQEGCFAIKNPNATSYPGYIHMHLDGGNHLVRWEKDNASDWYLYPVEYAPEEDVEFLIQNLNSGKYATRGTDDDAQLVQKARGATETLNSVWKLYADGSGYRFSNGGTTNKLAKVTSSGTFTADGIVWYLRKDPTATTYYNISNTSGNFTENDKCWNDYQSGGNVIDYWNASNDEGSRWSFIPVDVYYLNALAYLESLYDAAHNDELFYISEEAYETLTATVVSSADKIAKANAMYNVLNDYANFNMPENDKDYLIKSGDSNNGKYLNTVADGTRLHLDDYFNSSFFWNVEKDDDGKYYIRQSCYGTTDGEFPDTDPRYIDYTQPANDANPKIWLYTNSKPGTALNFDIYFGEGYTSIYTSDTSHRMSSNVNNVLTWDVKGNGSKWKFITVEEASADLRATAQAAIDNGNNGAFTLTPDAIALIQDAKDDLEDEPNYVNYYKLEVLLNATSSYFDLPTGRYLVRNYEFDPDGDPTVINDTETYLTSMLNPVGAVKEAINYWSIWDITNLGSGQYTMENEGHKYILAPGRQLDGNPATNERNAGSLFYDTSSNAFQVGNATASNDSTLLFYPAVAINDDVTGNYAAISVASQISQGKYLNMWTRNDHIANYSCTMGEHNGKGFFWEFIPIGSANLEGDPAWSEADMFKRKVDDLEGYVGGVVTLDNVSTVPCLQDIADLRDATVTALKNGTVLNYTNAPYEAVTINEIDSVGAKAYRAILDRIHDIKDGKVGESGTTDASIKKYYQDLRPTEKGPDESLGTGDDIMHPFFLENMSGQRPEFGARLTENSDGSWHSAPKATVTGNEGVFYVTRESGEPGQSDATYSLKNGNGKWLQHGDSTKTFKPILQTTTEGERMKFYIDPVIPGVWQIRDIQASGNVSDTQTLVTTSSDGVLRYYFGSEISSLWKFKTFNEIDTIFIKKAPAVTQISDKGMHYFCTFSYPIDFRYPKTKNPVPYYCSAAYRKSDGNLKLVFNEVPTSDADYYILEGNTGYLFMLPTDANEGGYNYDGKNIYIPDAQMISGGVPDGCKPDKNLMLPNLNKRIITAENYRDIYALAYKPEGDPIGSYYGTPALGVGMGFYHIRIGGWLNPNTAYIHRGSFVDDDSQFPSSSEVHESVMPAEITLEDGEGNIVDKIEVLPDGTWQSMEADDGPVYDLTGRRMEKPTRGIYIQNGRKVMFK